MPSPVLSTYRLQLRGDCFTFADAEKLLDYLDELGVSGLTVSEVMGCGRQKGYTEQYRGSRVNISLLPKIKVESVVSDEVTGKAVDAIVGAAYTGEIGDGRLFVYDVAESVRIRTGERGEETVRHEAPVGWGY
jgi:nitrogen regulatory protein P-II 1